MPLRAHYSLVAIAGWSESMRQCQTRATKLPYLIILICQFINENVTHGLQDMLRQT